MTENIAPNDILAGEKLTDSVNRIKKEIAKVIVGQEQVINDLLVSLFARGH